MKPRAVRGVNRNREREMQKVITPAEQWARLTKKQRAALLAYPEDPEWPTVHAKAIPALVAWWIVAWRQCEYRLTAWGTAMLEYARTTT